MSKATVRSGFDSWAGAGKPSQKHPREKALRLSDDAGNVAQAFLWMKSPVPRGATVTSATLTLHAKGSSSGSRTLTVRRLGQSWKQGRLNWNNRPTTDGAAVTKGVSGLSDGEAINVDVTAIVQGWANGNANYGLRVETSATNAHQIYSMNSARKPTLTVTWSDAPSTPTNLRPSEAATSLATPHLVFDYRDVSGNTSLAAVQVQISASETSFVAPDLAFDSGEFATTEAGLDLATSSFVGLTEGQTLYWRVRAKDGAGLWSTWSEVVSMTRAAKPTVAITNLDAGLAFEPTPPVLWTTTGTQTRFQVLVFEADDLTTAIYTSPETQGAETAFTIPSAARLQDDTTYRVEVRVWDDVARETTPGDPAYAEDVADFVLDTDAAVSPVSAFTAQAEDVSPWVALSWTRSTTPDSFVLLRDGKTLFSLDPLDVFVSGTSYAFRYFGARPNREHTYEVRAVVDGKASASNPTASLTTSPSGLWLVDTERGIDVTLWGNDEGSWNTVDDATVYAPVGSSQVVRVVNGMRGLEGNLTGLLMEGFGKTFEEMEDDLYEIKSNPTATVRIVAADENIEALIGNVRLSPKPETRGGRIVKGVSFDFWQVGTLPFKTRI